LDGKQLTDFTESNGNSIEVEVPYTLEPGENKGTVPIYYLSDRGEFVKVNASYNEGMAAFKLKQF
jgi:hypothetical protein